jgi:hypothetical protein
VILALHLRKVLFRGVGPAEVADRYRRGRLGGIHIVSFRNLASLFRPLGAEVSTRRYGTFGLSDERHYATFILGRRASTTSHAYAASFFSQRFCSSADALSLLEYGNFCLERIHAPIKAEIGRVHFFVAAWTA